MASINSHSPLLVKQKPEKQEGRSLLIYLFLIFTAFLTILFFALFTAAHNDELICEDVDDLTLTLLESIPEEVTLATPHSIPTTEGWLRLINSAKKSIDIGCFYMTLSQGPQGEDVFNALSDAIKRGIKVRIAQNKPSKSMPAVDTVKLQELGATVYTVDYQKAVGGVLHTKLIIVDQKSLYIGSANADWRALDQVKELGIMVENSPKLARDSLAIFDQFISIAQNVEHYGRNSPKFAALFNYKRPYCFNSKVNNTNEAKVFITAAPTKTLGMNREDDLETIKRIITSAEKYVYVSVMDYQPANSFPTDRKQPYYWPDIDSLLRAVAFDNSTKIRLMASKWDYTKKSLIPFLKSLNAVPNIEVKIFEIPHLSDGRVYDHTRVNHAKFMVTDKTAFIGTSNWDGSYFLNTAGSSFIIDNYEEMRKNVADIFMRDWNSKYAKSVDLY
ncbi:hypothetical protein RCL1_005637 [Eukaryota sp. TZLM3-RCL]